MSTSSDPAVDADTPDYVHDIAQFRADFRRFLRESPQPAAWRSAAFDNAEDQMAHDAQVMAELFELGWNRYGWPAEVGGLGGDAIHRAVFYEELGNALIAIPAQQWTLEVMGPAALKYAPELAKQYLPDYLAGAEWWGQGFSEPEAGSDLASLRTKACATADAGFVINGQKIWTSQGATARRLFVLARTGEPDSRHRGLTMFLVDVDTPGVTVRPIALASGRRELAEVFFDDVHVPADRVLGDIGSGWALTMFLMQFERGMYGYAVLNKVLTELSRLRQHMVTAGSSHAHRKHFAQVYVQVSAALARTAATVRKLSRGDTVGPGSSIDKLLFGRAEKAANDLILDVRRSWMIAAPDSAKPAEVDTARAEWWYSRAATIMGGTAEVQLGIIADHLLGLPKEKR